MRWSDRSVMFCLQEKMNSRRLLIHEICLRARLVNDWGLWRGPTPPCLVETTATGPVNGVSESSCNTARSPFRGLA